MKQPPLDPLRVFGRLEDGVTLEGAMQEMATTDLYHNVLVFDFKSLYPSLIRTFQIDPLGFIADPSEADEAIYAPNKAAFCRAQGILLVNRVAATCGATSGPDLLQRHLRRAAGARHCYCCGIDRTARGLGEDREGLAGRRGIVARWGRRVVGHLSSGKRDRPRKIDPQHLTIPPKEATVSDCSLDGALSGDRPV